MIRRLSKAYSFVSLAFLLATLAFIIAAGRFAILGFQSRLTNKPAFAQDLFVSVLTIVTAVIAIFFAGAALVVEIILGAYTSQFVRAFVRHWIFLLSLVLMILIAIANLLLLRLGWNESLADASLVSAIYVIVCLGILVWLLTRFLQVPLIVGEVSSQVLVYIRKNLPRPHASLHRFRNQPGGYDRILDKLKVTAEFYILGRVPSTPLPLTVPAEFSKGLQEHTRPIFSACLRAITQDRRDIALACFDSIVTISTTYLEARRNYAFPDDSFLDLMHSQLEILFNAALKQANEQFTADIVEVATKIGQASLLLTESQIRPDTNDIAGRCVHFLARSCLQSLPLRHTSAPLAACEGITQIGRGLLMQRAYTTALHGVVESLKQVGRQTASTKGIWSSNITQRAIWGLVLMLNDVFVMALDEGYYQRYASKHLCDALDSITQTAFAQERSFDAYRVISAPLVESLRPEGNIVDVFYLVLQPSLVGTESMHRQLVLDTIPIVELLLRTGLRIIRQEGDCVGYSSALSAMTWGIVRFLENQKDTQLIRVARETLRKVLLAAHSYVNRVIEESPDILFDHLQHLSPIYAFMIYFAQRHGNQILTDELFAAVEELSNLLPQFAETAGDTAAYRNLYSYIKMYAAWIYKYFPQSPLVSKLFHLLAENIPPEVEIPHFLRSRMELWNYPSGLGSDEWYIFPSRYWGPDSQQAITDELNDPENYRAFDELLEGLKSGPDTARL